MEVRLLYRDELPLRRQTSNVWIEGLHVSAVQNGLAPRIWLAEKKNICDPRMEGGLWAATSSQVARHRRLAGRFCSVQGHPRMTRCGQLLAAGASSRSSMTATLPIARRKVENSITTEILADSYERMRADED